MMLESNVKVSTCNMFMMLRMSLNALILMFMNYYHDYFNVIFFYLLIFNVQLHVWMVLFVCTVTQVVTSGGMDVLKCVLTIRGEQSVTTSGMNKMLVLYVEC